MPKKVKHAEVCDYGAGICREEGRWYRIIEGLGLAPVYCERHFKRLPSFDKKFYVKRGVLPVKQEYKV